ncbi:helix-turn-helix domain-containing protein [Catelliglobosispora koreensis]|uniref:helix-turn-helix domain-containing protein n=1 Tax=Catelliglobosispora koreensis TaxID=129052 RepID=UPI00037C35A2|nr:helix-turn-helix domain-containing protein [Catelliglobosispora koreensis]
MSIQAITWTLNNAPNVPPSLVATLLALASHADPNGQNAAPSQARLAHYTRKTSRTIRRDLTTLQHLGLIRRGDQNTVAYLPPDRRPIVWDLAVEQTRPTPEPHNGNHRANRGTARHQQTGHRQDACARPAAHSPWHHATAGRTRPPARHYATSPNSPRADAHAHRIFTEEEKTTSPHTHTAEHILRTLSPTWRIGAHTVTQLTPAIAAALRSGWSPEQLHQHLSANIAGIRCPQAVLRARVHDLPPPKPIRPHHSPQRTGRCREHPTENAKHCRACRSEAIARPDDR